MAAVAYFWKAEEDFGHETEAREQLGQEGRQRGTARTVGDHVLNASSSPVGSQLYLIDLSLYFKGCPTLQHHSDINALPKVSSLQQ